MQRICSLGFVPALLVENAFSFPASAAPDDLAQWRAAPQASDAPRFERPRERYAATGRNMGGGLLEFLFSGDEAPRTRGPIYAPGYSPGYGEDDAPRYRVDPRTLRDTRGQLIYKPEAERAEADPKYQKQIVEYSGREKPGTIVIDTPNRFLYLVQSGGTALRYGIGVGRPGFTWAGAKSVTMKREWPDWRPPSEMLKRRPDLPRYMPGGPENPLGARALYLGSSLYRIHGSNEPWTIGTAVSSGCIRMRNDDVIDLYNRVPVGARVIVI